MKRINRFLYVLSCIALTSSCTHGKYDIVAPGKPDLIDPDLNLNREDYKNLNYPDRPKSEGESDTSPTAAPGDAKASTNVLEPPVPDLAEILAAPKPPKIGETQLVSVAVTDDVPLKDVLIELARLADVDIELDANIVGGISFRAKDRPFNEVIDRIADLAGLRYTMKNNVLRIERDTPYVQVYSLNFLNMDRSAQGSIDISTNVLSAAASSGGGGGGGASGGGSGASGASGGSSSGGGGASGVNSGSTETITTKYDSDFWKQFEASVKQILTYKESNRISSASIAEQPTTTPAAKEEPDAAAKTADAAKGEKPAAAAAAAAADASSAGGAKLATSDAPFYILNREAATLTISASQRQHEMIKEFIRKIQANATSQVLIEAKIVEVTLSDQYQSGINWTKLGTNKVNFVSQFGGVTDPTNIATLALNPTNDLAAAVQLAQTFGTTRTLSSPRLHAINNQQAVLTFAQNQVYFSLTVTNSQNASTTGTVSNITVNSVLHTVPIGIILTLQPSINTEANEVTLNVRPTLSRIVGNVADPAIAFLIAQANAQAQVSGTPPITGITNAVPVIEVREMDSILKLKSGQVMVIGGLMQDESKNTDSGIPALSSVPWLGNIFKGVDKENTVSELVIFIRATIIDSGGDADHADKSVYEKFTKDPRPLKF